MKRTIMAAIAALGTTLALGISSAPALALSAGGSWKAQAPPAGVAASVDYHGVFFTDTMHGAVVGGQDGRPTAIYTTDGGKTWKAGVVPNPSTAPGKMFAVAFTSTLHGFAVGEKGDIYSTIDGGANWLLDGSTPQPPLVDELRDVRFADATHGCGVGRGRPNVDGSPVSAIVCTSNGGTTWTKVTPANVPNAGTLEGISYGDTSTAFAVGDSGILKSTNADVADVTTMTWTKLTDPPANPGNSPAQFGDVHCVNATHCWLAGDQTTTGGTTSVGSGVIAITTDGTTFSLQVACANPGLEAIAFAPRDLNSGLAGGGDTSSSAVGSACSTGNGGTTWQAAGIGAPHEIVDLAIVDACHAWAVTESNGIMAFACPPAPTVSPSASVAPVGLPRAGAPVQGASSGAIPATLILLVGAGGLLALWRTRRTA